MVDRFDFKAGRNLGEKAVHAGHMGMEIVQIEVDGLLLARFPVHKSTNKASLHDLVHGCANSSGTDEIFLRFDPDDFQMIAEVLNAFLMYV